VCVLGFMVQSLWNFIAWQKSEPLSLSPISTSLIVYFARIPTPYLSFSVSFRGGRRPFAFG
jgi:hypothetical protein